MRIALLLVLAACGRSPHAATPKVSGPPDKPSLERVERIARACVQGLEQGPVYATATLKDRRWTSQVRVGDAELSIDPTSSTCGDKQIASRAEDGDRSLDEVLAIARTCHTAPHGAVWVTFVVGPNAVLDSSRFVVSFDTPGPAKTFPAPAYLVDLATRTCGPSPGPHM